MGCTRINDRLDDYLDRDLPGAEMAALDAHIRECGDCAGTVERENELRTALASLPVEGPSTGFFERAVEKAVKEGQRQNRGGGRTAAVFSAIAASLALVVAVTFFVGGPDEPSPEIAGLTMAMHDMKTVNLVFSSKEALTDAVLVVHVPPGIEIQGYAGRQEIRWTTNLRAGKNVLPLELVAQDSGGGELVARLEHANKSKTFRIQVTVM